MHCAKSPLATSAPTVKRSTVLPATAERSCLDDVNRTFGPARRRVPGSNGASRVCFKSNSACIKLDLPELFAPARMVSGRISTVCSTKSDLNPATTSFVMPGTDSLEPRSSVETLFKSCSVPHTALIGALSVQRERRKTAPACVAGMSLISPGLLATSQDYTPKPPWTYLTTVLYPLMEIPSSRAAVPPRIASRSASLRPGVSRTRSTAVFVHGYG